MARSLCLLGLGFLIAACPSLASAPPAFGQFVGVLRHESAGVEQLAKLDFILDRDNGNTMDLSAILTLHFGDFASREYVTYVFDKVRFDVLLGTLTFDQGDQDLTITVRRFEKEQFEGTVRSAFGDTKIGSLLLRREIPAEPVWPVIPSLAGRYEADNGQILILHTFRSANELGGIGNPFGANGVTGRMARYEQALGGIVVNNVFTSGSYDFFKHRLVLWGSPQAMECVVSPQALECDQGSFKRIADAGTSALSPPFAEQRPMPGIGEHDFGGETHRASEFGGQYVGYLHHDYLDQYQIAAVNIVAIPGGSASPGTLTLSATASLTFGDIESLERLTYKFEPRLFPLNSKVFVFERKGIDAVLQVTSASAGVLEGLWYSRVFGRVGRFALFKKGLPSLPVGHSLAPAVSRLSRRGFWELREAVGLGTTPPSMANPFFPLTFGGYLWDVRGFLISKSPIKGGTYDFYTGRLALLLSIDDESLPMVGTRDKTGALNLTFYLSNKWGVLLRPLTVTF